MQPRTPLLDGAGSRQRELLFGQGFHVLAQEETRAWGFAAHDGYLGWVEAAALGPALAPSHRVSAIRSYAKATPKLKVTEPEVPLSFGALLCISGTEGPWARAEHPLCPIYLPSMHIAPVSETAQDPAAVAEAFLGTPYLWGGNSAFGIDCSGLVQAALLACGIQCPGDSDMQEAELGAPLPPDAALKRGDLLFWKGHVALAVDAERLIHANAHHMAVVYEGAEEAISRIAAQGGGPVSTRRLV